MRRTLRFRHDGTFRVLQMADVQDGPDVDPDTVVLIEAAIRRADPDLVVFTGDQIRGYDPAWMHTFLRRRGERPGDSVREVTRLEAWWRRRFGGPNQPGPDDWPAGALMADARAKVRRCFAGFLAPIVRAGVPFAATYGNHDFQCGILADEQDRIYREFPGCLNPDAQPHQPGRIASSPSAPIPCEPGTFALPVMASDGSNHIAMGVTLVNSGDYATEHPSRSDTIDGEPSSHLSPAARRAIGRNASRNAGPATSQADYARDPRKIDLADSDGYGSPTPQALAWLAESQREMVRRNGDGRPVPAIAFQHIPPQEFYDCLKEVPPFTPNAVEGTRAFAGRCYVLDRSVCRPGSRLGEAIGCADVNCGQVQTMVDAGGYFALFCGHDHKNAFVGHVDGLDLGYAPTCGFASYGPKSRLRGIRLFEFHESDPSRYTTRMLTYGELVGRRSRNETRVFFGDHLVTDGPSLRDQLRRPSVFVTIVGIAGGVAAAIGSACARGTRRLLNRPSR
ncbi:metallophosphoesterase [Bifidobacterium vespertilionis]|uniref:metallophosphoesterase n=1 Tax=Bifidobacterium vespertilionis TaxID=2562524 RepID=UPI001BDC300D|nr:metallophosphoesterase [Bifidobacterium vespertilionis]MBT1179369.1 metallophosphoesterase [Bifidobacterium vespertilionis]